MLASIHPLGERVRHNRWSITVTAYLLGSAAGGVVAGTVAAAAGRLLRLTALPSWSVAVLLAAALAVDLMRRGRHLPGPSRQVNEDWLNRYRGWVYGFGFGFQLGAAVTTIVTTASTYAFLAIAALTADLRAGAVIGLVFGVARALPVLALRGARNNDDLRRFHRRLAALAPPARHLTAAALVLLTGLAAAR